MTHISIQPRLAVPSNLLTLKPVNTEDLERLRAEYEKREHRRAGSCIYSLLDPANLFIIQQRQRTLLKLLHRHGFNPLGNRRILDLGCGRGETLLEFLGYGVKPERLHGADLLFQRLKEAHTLLPHLSLTCADGQHLPYASEVFDLVLQYTVFSSILDEKIKVNLAREILRVLKPGGLILWYDFWLNPINQQTRGMRPVEIRHLFPACTFEFHRITLAPPLTRRLAPISWLACALLEKLKVLNTHYLVAIRKQS